MWTIRAFHCTFAFRCTYTWATCMDLLCWNRAIVSHAFWRDKAEYKQTNLHQAEQRVHYLWLFITFINTLILVRSGLVYADVLTYPIIMIKVCDSSIQINMPGLDCVVPAKLLNIKLWCLRITSNRSVTSDWMPLCMEYFGRLLPPLWFSLPLSLFTAPLKWDQLVAGSLHPWGKMDFGLPWPHILVLWRTEGHRWQLAPIVILSCPHLPLLTSSTLTLPLLCFETVNQARQNYYDALGKFLQPEGQLKEGQGLH